MRLFLDFGNRALISESADGDGVVWLEVGPDQWCVERFMQFVRFFERGTSIFVKRLKHPVFRAILSLLLTLHKIHKNKKEREKANNLRALGAMQFHTLVTPNCINYIAIMQFRARLYAVSVIQPCVFRDTRSPHPT